MEKKGKLELTWVGKYEEEKLEPRILIEDKSKSYGDPDTENMLIHGDNLLALKALEMQYRGKIKCVYIDPPYNTGSAFEQYDDDLEHSIWLGIMRRRLQIIQKLLSDPFFVSKISRMHCRFCAAEMGTYRPFSRSDSIALPAQKKRRHAGCQHA